LGYSPRGPGLQRLTRPKTAEPKKGKDNGCSHGKAVALVERHRRAGFDEAATADEIVV